MIYKPKDYLWHGFGTLLLCIFSDLFFGPICNSEFMGSFNKFFDSFNLYEFCRSFTDHSVQDKSANTMQESELNNDILLFNIAGSKSRADIAGKLQEITNLKPKVIGMDVIYPERSVTTTEEDDSLLHVVSRCPQLVTALRVNNTDAYNNGHQEEHSFYTKLGNVDEACINVEDGVIRHFTRELEVNGKKYQCFVDRIIERAYPDAYKRMNERGQNEERINYEPINFLELGMNDELFPEDVKDKIVLIGDFDDYGDFHDIPSKIGDQSRISGTTIHAYAINTIVKDKYVNHMGEWGGILLGLIATYLFSILCCVCFVECEKLSGFIILILTIIFEFIAILLYGIAANGFNYEPEIAPALTGIGLAGFACEIWFWLCTTKPYGWFQRRLHLPDGGIRAFISNEEAKEAWAAKKAEKAKRKAERTRKKEETKKAKETTKK